MIRTENSLSREILGCGLAVHGALGPGLLVVEIKSALRWEPVFEAQMMTYLKLTDLRLGLLLNFQVPFFRDGIKRVVRGLEDTQFGLLGN